MDNIELTRLEFNRVSFRRMLKEKLGCDCANCGFGKDVEYHHIVPIIWGGTNKLTNIVPLCHKCHQLAHGSRNIRDMTKAKETGRKKKKPPKGYEKIIDSYLKGSIGRKECEEKLGFTHGLKLTDKWYFKEYLKQNKIVSYKNRVDMLNTPKCKAVDHTGELLAEIIYVDGTKFTKYIQ